MKIDMHCHTSEGSIDSKVGIRRWIQLLQERGFDGMLVTDHDSYSGYRYYLDRRKYMPRGFTVLMGIEYDTKDAGHFLVIMPNHVHLRLLRFRGMSVEMLIRVVHAYGGVLGPAHPFGMRSSSAMFFKKMQENPDIMKEFDFLEGFNTCELSEANLRAQELAESYDLPCTAGSDAHDAEYIGMAFTDFDRPIRNNNDLIRAIKEGAIIAYGGTEREFLKKHRKRYWAVTTYAFRAMNRSVGVLFHPYRQYKIQKMDIPD